MPITQTRLHQLLLAAEHYQMLYQGLTSQILQPPATSHQPTLTSQPSPANNPFPDDQNSSSFATQLSSLQTFLSDLALIASTPDASGSATVIAIERTRHQLTAKKNLRDSARRRAKHQPPTTNHQSPTINNQSLLLAPRLSPAVVYPLPDDSIPPDGSDDSPVPTGLTPEITEQGLGGNETREE